MDDGMKFCIKCGKKIPEAAEFCNYCGTNQVVGDKTQFADDTAKVTDTSHNNDKNESKPGLLNSVKRYWDDMFTISKRMSRADYWWGYLGLAIVSLVLYLIYSGLYSGKPTMGYFNGAGLFFYSFPRFVGLLIFSFIYAGLAVMGFSAEVRRLHDSNKSGHFLWLSLIPVVGFILIIVFLCQASNEKGSRFDKNKPHKSWLKKWWTWVVLIVVTLVFTVTLDSANFEDMQSRYDAAPTTKTATTDDDSDDSDAESESSDSSKTISIDSTDVKLTDSNVYKTDFSDKSWSGTNVSISKIMVATTDGFTYDDGDGDEDYEGLIMVKFNITAGRDISIYPTQGTLSTDDGQQIEADSYDGDDFDGDLDSGTKASGYAVFPIKKLSSVDQFTTLRIKFDASYDTDDIDDENDFHTYDVSLNLND